MALALMAALFLSGTTAQASNGNRNVARPLSEPTFNLDAEYYFDAYNATALQHGEDTVFHNKDIIIHSLTYDQLPYLLQQKGNFLIFFGGVWNSDVRKAIPYINEYAKAYGIDEVYNFDFRLDGASAATDVENLTNETKNPYGKLVKADEYNYLYGEIVKRYLTNLDDWTKSTSTTSNAVVWKNVDGKTYTNAARLQTPFVFVYNKDSIGHPILSAVEGYTSNYKKDVRKVFHYAFEHKLQFSTYSDGEYYADALIENNIRGHAPKLYNIFKRDEQINLNVINYNQLNWLLSQDGEAIVLIAGPWCANSTAAFGPINDYAVANGLQVYVFDDRLDGKYPIDFWGYNRDRQFKSRDWSIPGRDGELNPNAYLYIDLVKDKLANMEVTGHSRSIFYLDSRGDTVSAPASQSPYLFDFNKSGIDGNSKRPIISWYEKMFEVNEENLRPEKYLYTKANYTEYTSGIKKVFGSYAARTNHAAIKDPEKLRRHLVDFRYLEIPQERRPPFLEDAKFGKKKSKLALDSESCSIDDAPTSK